uniref:Uncharacterized protein LOC103958750 isoform X2 n=1 Tax=Rhizophora mucronata TaxID=61149 RepID=A0A2P2LGN8_RHIMU
MFLISSLEKCVQMHPSFLKLKNFLVSYDYSSSKSNPPIRCLLLSKTALKDSRSALSCSWNMLCWLDLPMLWASVLLSSSGNGLDFCKCRKHITAN